MTFIDNSKAVKREIELATIRAITQACMTIEGQALLLAPVATAWLKNSIGYEVSESELIGYVGTAVEYAIYVEFGTGEFAENGKGRKGGWIFKDPFGEVHFTYGSRPKPYLRPAFEKNKKVLEEFLKKELGAI